MEVSGWDEQKYDALTWIGKCYLKLEDYIQAKNAYFRAIDLRADWPMAYHLLAETYMLEEDYKNAVQWFENGFKIPKPDIASGVSNPNLTYIPLQQLSMCLFQLGRIKEAIAAMKQALEFDPQNKGLLELLAGYQALQDKIDVAKAYIKIAKYLDKYEETEKLKLLSDSTPLNLVDSKASMELK